MAYSLNNLNPKKHELFKALPAKLVLSSKQLPAVSFDGELSGQLINQ